MERENNILNKAQELSGLTASNLSKLVRIQSFSGNEKAVQQELSRQLQEAGVDEVRFDGLGNVIGKIGNGKTILAFDGHVDTVGVGNAANWQFDPFSGEIKDGFVHGRGSVDQKGGVAAFVTAAKIIRELGLADHLTVYFVGSVMEEDCDGLCWKYLVEEEGLRPDVVVSTEPTNMNIYRGQRGRMEMDISFTGISAHGSAPERGKNAIYMASKACLEIEKLNWRLKKDDFLGKGSVTVTQFESDAPSMCAVADYAKIHLDRRLTWGETRDTAIAEVLKIAGGKDVRVEVPVYRQTSWTGKEYGMEQYFPTWKIPEEHPAIQNAIQAYKNIFEKDPLVGRWTFSTNGVTINGFYGIPVIGFGPGDESLAHAPDEKVPVNDLVEASAYYASFTKNLSKNNLQSE